MNVDAEPHRLSCWQCGQHFAWSAPSSPLFCPFCAASLKESSSLKASIHPSIQPELLSSRYQILETIGKGGMGEVLLAFDTVCGRRIAIKRIREDLLEHPQIRHRFLKEAHITCQLTHPAIIPIYSIQAAHLSAFYTMPFVEGETLKQIIRKTKEQERKGEALDHIGGSIPALMRIFMTICQAVAYAHARGVLHRDLKLENIIVGKYGEVLILDWGLAKHLHNPVKEPIEKMKVEEMAHAKNSSITKIGKVVGTVAYMAPERALGQIATIQTEIYSLGVILYQMLTLKAPFKRGTLKEFCLKMKEEVLVDPLLAAPYRDVPRILARITQKCLHINPQKRYASVDQIIHDLENYLEGRSDWFQVAKLEIAQKNDWEFQEYVLIAEHLAVTRSSEEIEWVHLMISKQSFSGNIRIEACVSIGELGHGIGILFSVPEPSERKTITDGYCLWLGSDLHRSTKLMRSNVEVMQAPDIFLKRHQPLNIRIEKVEKTIHLFLDEVLQFSYVTHLPLIGTHVGILSRDSDFQLDSLQIFVGSLNLNLNCLAVPDAFLAHRDFAKALSEYRRIAYSFPDRPEGREAIFRAGLTFIEEAKGAEDKTFLLDQALDEFEKLHNTPSAPLEYLGKSLVYQAQNEPEEEIKCFEIAYRRYPRHPLLSLLQEQILSRMHETSRERRIATYRFILLAVRHLPPSCMDTHTKRLFSSLQKHWEPLGFIEEQAVKFSSPLYLQRFAIPLGFNLNATYVLEEIIEELPQKEPGSWIEMGNALSSLIELRAFASAERKIEHLKQRAWPLAGQLEKLELMLRCQEALPQVFRQISEGIFTKPDFAQMRLWLYALDQAIDSSQTHFVHDFMEKIKGIDVSFETRLRLDQRALWALLIEGEWQKANVIFSQYPFEFLNQESSLLHFLYGCFLQATEGTEVAMIHFNGLLHVPYPRSWTLASHALTGNLRDWQEKSFLWERRSLYRQLALYCRCAQEMKRSHEYQKLYQE